MAAIAGLVAKNSYAFKPSYTDTPGTRVDDFGGGSYSDRKLLDRDGGSVLYGGPAAAVGTGTASDVVDTKLQGTPVDPGKASRFDQEMVLTQDQAQDQTVGPQPLLRQDCSQRNAGMGRGTGETMRTPGRQPRGGFPPIPRLGIFLPSPNQTGQDLVENDQPVSDEPVYSPSLGAGVFEIMTTEPISDEQEFTGLEPRSIRVDTE